MPKRILWAFLFILFLFLPSCKKTPPMQELLLYEKAEISFTLSVKDGGEHQTVLTLSENGDTFLFPEGTLAGMKVIFSSDDRVTMEYGAHQMPLPSSSLLKLIRWRELFSLSEKELLWNIKEENLGGTAVYTCQAGDVTVYIDRGTLLPLKLTSGGVSIDVLGSENHTPIEPKA